MKRCVLQGDEQRRRLISITSFAGRMTVLVHVREKSGGQGALLAYASAPVDECDVDPSEHFPAIWIGSASFELSAQEVRQLTAAIPSFGANAQAVA